MFWYLKALKNYATFTGRARRKEYWSFFLINLLILFILSSLFRSGIISDLYALAVLLPMLALTIRLLHDTNRSGWHILLNFIPVIGSIILIFFTLQDSSKGKNRFGDDPKDALLILL